MIKLTKHGSKLIIESIKGERSAVRHIHTYIFNTRKQLSSDLLTQLGTTRGLGNYCKMIKEEKKYLKYEDVNSDNIESLRAIVYDKLLYYNMYQYLDCKGLIKNDKWVLRRK